MPYTQILYQLVWSTKYRTPALSKPNRVRLFKYMTGVVLNKKCRPYSINGVEDHVHLVLSIHPSLSLSNLVKDVKIASSIFIKEERLFPLFTGWQKGYAAFTYHERVKDRLVNYVETQEAHHAKSSFLKEFKEILAEHKVEFDEKYLFD